MDLLTIWYSLSSVFTLYSYLENACMCFSLVFPSIFSPDPWLSQRFVFIGIPIFSSMVISGNQSSWLLLYVNCAIQGYSQIMPLLVYTMDLSENVILLRICSNIELCLVYCTRFGCQFSSFSPLLIFHFSWNLCRGISWVTKDGVQQANYFGSLTQASTCRVGSFQGEEVYAPFKSLLPMVSFLHFSL